MSNAASVSVITGNKAAAEAARLARVQVVAAYPITPQSQVVETLASYVETGKLDAEFITVESEHSAMGVCIGASIAGSRVFTASSANGLAYMCEQLSWAAGSRLPIVMGCADRALSAPWNVLNDQQDAMSQRDQGWIQLYCRDNQEIFDTFLQAFRLAEEVRLPVLVCYDGFILSHTVMPVSIPTQEEVDAFLPPFQGRTIVDLEDPRNINPVTLANPRNNADGTICHGYMEFRALMQQAHLASLAAIDRVDQEFASRFGRATGGVTWSHALEDADVILLAAGSLANEATVASDYLREQGVRAGVLGLRSYRPFPAARVAEQLSEARLVTVFDKSLSYGYGGPIFTDTQAALFSARKRPEMHSYIAGLGGRDVKARELADAVSRSLDWVAQENGQKEAEWLNLQL
ncbi:MAG TPA: transketolase C-terminal domain-containing protein [Candidatus Hydrogenedentes bacterium]|nr:transketolase C-terminal domain-containing protein [Candidatus Hydrogenedentota bacterium]